MVIPFALLLAGLAGCGSRESAAPSDTTATAPAPAAAATGKDPLPAGSPPAPIGPITSRGQTVPEAGAGAPAARIDFDLPAGWQSEPPSSGMRLAQATIPGAAGPGQIVVFYFGPGSGGTADANIQRWIDQMEPAPGSHPKPATFQNAHGFKVTWIDVAGTLQPSQMGTGPTAPQPNARLLGAVVEGPGGPWFFKATGPDATLAANRDAFLALLKSVRPK